MGFSERMKELLDQGVAASKEFAVKAGAKAQDLGERGVLMLEMKQLEGQAKKLMGRLGAEVYKAFEKGSSVSFGDPEISAILGEIGPVKEAIEKKEQEIRSRGQN
ncbi:MAG: hypothetical protein LBP27_02115 [Treponema sp.]|jgi:hypothetical protein|nr:hypothetical protein [Treponema sp.]